MALTSIELIDVLRQAACGIEQGDLSHKNSLPIDLIVKEIKECGLATSGLEQLENIRIPATSAASSGIARHFRNWADVLEKQLLAMLDLPVDISFMRQAA